MNIGIDYNTHRENLFDIFECYKESRICFDDLFKSKNEDGVDIDYLQEQIDLLKQEKFIIAVAGEVKSGKSTFLNALLGEEILPSDVLQATSAIIEIFKSDRKHTIVKYASGREEEFDDVKNLYELAQLSDEYRDIPTTLINSFIINSDEKIELSDELIHEWQIRSNEDNLNSKRGKIEKYLQFYTKDTIPVEIKVGYPLKWEFDEIVIVDSPGVNAIGGVQDISFEYFSKANALLFIKQIKPIESESFKTFIDKTITKKSKENLFLILTHISDTSKTEADKLYNEAVRIYGNKISTDKILAVDSLLQVLLNDLRRGVPLKEIRKDEMKKRVLSPYREEAEDQGRDLESVIKDAAKFDQAAKVIDKFSTEAPRQQIANLIERVKKGFEEQNKRYTEEIENIESKKVRPQQFAITIESIIHALKEYKSKLSETVEVLHQKYSGVSEWRDYIISFKDDCLNKINESTHEDEIRKHYFDYYEGSQLIIDDYIQSITNELKDNVGKEDVEFKKKHRSVTIPILDYSGLVGKTKRLAYKEVYKYEEEYEGLWENKNFINFRWTKKSRAYKVNERFESVYNPVRHMSILKNKLKEELSSTAIEMERARTTIFDDIKKEFTLSYETLIQKRTDHLKTLKEEKKRNDELIELQAKYRKKKELLSEPLSRIYSILEDLK